MLQDLDNRHDIYLRCLEALNTDYKPDRVAFSAMTKGRTMASLFPKHQYAESIYAMARKKEGNAPFLLQQMAVYEMQRSDGDLNAAREYLSDARRQEPHNPSLIHSLSELHLSLANTARNPVEESAHLNEAKKIAEGLKRDNRSTSHGHHTVIKIALRHLERLIKAGNDDEITGFDSQLKEVEQAIREALQRFPDDSHILDAEASLATLLNQSERSVMAIKRAFDNKPRSPYLAIRLARIYSNNGLLDEARGILKKALNVNPGERQLHFAYAKLLIEHGGAEEDEVEHHLQRSFTSGDRNYYAKILYARELFSKGRGREAANIFQDLSTARVGSSMRNRVIHLLDERFYGTVNKKEPTYCFVVRDSNRDDWIYLHQKNASEIDWNELRVGTRISFRIGFTFKGASAVEVQIEN